MTLASPSLKETELGLLPEDWGIVSIGDSCEKPQYGFTASASLDPVGPQFLRIPDIQEGGVDWGRVPFCRCSEETKAKYRLRPGELLFARIGATTGKTFLVRHCPEAVFASYLIRVRPKTVEPDFLYYFCSSEMYWRQINANKGDKLKGGISGSLLVQVRHCLPPLPEQQAIAYIFSRIQAAVEVQEKIVATLGELKAATMAKLFREGLRGAVAELRQTRFGQVPADWVTQMLADVGHIQTGLAKGRRISGESDTIELPYLRVANVQDGYLELSEIKTIELKKREIPRYSLQVGDVLLTEGGDCDKLGRGYLWKGQIPNCVHQNHIFAVRTDRAKLLPEFFAYLVQSPYGKGYFLNVAHKTTNLARINSSKLKAFPVILPDLSEQHGIAEALWKLDRLVDSQGSRLRLLRSLFSSLLHLLMTGQVRVPARMIARLSARFRAQRARPAGKPVDEAVVQEIVRRIVDAVAPEKIILFGSAARGEMGPDSDLDFLVVKPCEDRRETARQIYQRLRGVGAPKDIVVVTPEDIERHRDTIGLIIRPALREGKVVYAA